MFTRLRGTRRLVMAAVMGLVATVLVSNPAWAEGSWSSYLDQVRVGFESRRWYDGNVDAANTTIGVYGSCWVEWPTQGSQDFQLRVYQVEPWYLPDTNRGTGSYNCFTSGNKIVNWGRLAPNDDYYFKVVSIGGQTGSTPHLTMTCGNTCLKVYY